MKRYTTTTITDNTETSECSENFTQGTSTRFEKLSAAWNFYLDVPTEDAEDEQSCLVSYLFVCAAVLLLIATIVVYGCY